MSQFEAMFADIESFGYDAYFGNYTKKFTEIRDIAHQQKNDAVVKRAQLELEVLSLHTEPPIVNNNFKARFIPMFGWNNGNVWPDVNDFTADDMRYIQTRLETTTNIFLRCRYADFIIEFGNKFGIKNIFSVARTFVPTLVAVVDAYSDNEDDIGLIHLLARGVQVSLKMKSEDMLRLVTDNVFTHINKFIQANEYRWILELALMVREVARSPLGASLSKAQYDQCFNALVAGKQHYLDVKEHYFHRSFCEEVINWSKLGGLTSEDISNIQTEIGKSFEEEALYQQGREQKSSLVKAHFYEQAMHHYSNIGAVEKIEEMKVKIRQSYEQSSGEMNQINTSVNIPIETIDSIIQPYLKVTTRQALELLSLTQTFIPDSQSIEEQTKKQEKDSPLRFMASRSILDDGKKVVQAIEDDDSYRMAYDSNYMLHLNMNNGILLTPLLERLIQDKQLNADEFVDRILSWPLMSSKNASLVEIGIRKFFEADYISSLHILVPQFESCLRRMFAQAGFATTSIKKGMAQHEETFNEFLNRADIKEVIGESLHKFIQMIMVEQTGMNLRNKIAHGLISVEDCNKQVNTIVLYLFLLITIFVLNDNEADTY